MMKRSAKIWLHAATLLLLCGTLLFVNGMSARHWDFSSLGSAEYETRTFEITESFQNISLHSDAAAILFTPSENGACRVEVYDRPSVKVSAAVEHGTLAIECVETKSWFESFSFSLTTPKITVYLPQSEYSSLTVQGDTGSVTLPGDFRFEDIQISASTGDIECCASCSGPIRIGNSTGDIRVRDLSAESLSLSVSTGEVTVSSVRCEGPLNVTVSTGRVRLSDIACGSLMSQGSTGSIHLENVVAEETFSIERSTGDVKLGRCDASELLIRTDTGDVTGSLLSEKVFLTQSDTGRINVPATTSGGTCKISTDTGDIKITIV